VGVDLVTLIEEVRGLRRDVSDMREELQRYRGFAAGAAWCLATIGGVVGFVWGMLFD
jgi:hypothetical protein